MYSEPTVCESVSLRIGSRLQDQAHHHSCLVAYSASLGNWKVGCGGYPGAHHAPLFWAPTCTMMYHDVLCPVENYSFRQVLQCACNWMHLKAISTSAPACGVKVWKIHKIWSKFNVLRFHHIPSETWFETIAHFYNVPSTFSARRSCPSQERERERERSTEWTSWWWTCNHPNLSSLHIRRR